MFKWFERFKRQGQNDEHLERMKKLVAQTPGSRGQHYTFAHRLLPGVARHLGALSVLVLADEDKRDEFLLDIWNDSGRDEKGDNLVASEGLRASVSRTDDKLIAIVVLPPAKRIPEAHFVAIMCDLPPETDDEDAENSEEAREVFRLIVRSMPVRYFTLERGSSLDGTPHTVFCEWTAEGAHHNMGDGPPAAEREFFRFLAGQNFPPVRASFDPNRARPVQDGE